MIDIRRGKYIGKLVGDPPKDEAEHFIRCPACGGWTDCSDLAQVFEHEGPLPHQGAGPAAMTKKKPRYEPRVFDGRIIQSDEIERIHKGILGLKHIEVVFDPMRELIEDLWPELASKLPPKKAQG
jgi:hypothetical protein